MIRMIPDQPRESASMSLISRRTAMVGASSLLLMPLARAQTQNFTVQRNLEYGKHDGVALLGDLYVPAAPGKYPVVVAVHGGGWQAGSKDGYRYWGPWLAQRGIAVFSADYRLSKPDRKMFPESVHDIRAAVQFVRSRGEAIKVDPDRIGMMGDSAGGHLVALVALAGDHPTFKGTAYMDDPYAGVSTRVKAVVPGYGVFELVQQWNHDQVNRPRDNIVEKYLGAAPMDNRKLYFDASPISYATRANSGISFLITNGTEDDIVDRLQSDNFMLALKQSGNFARHIVMQGSGHFWMSDPIEEPESIPGFFAPRVLRFLQERL
jgi:acetyl esterase/lipase